MENQNTTALNSLTALKDQILNFRARLAEAPKKPEKPVVVAPVEEQPELAPAAPREKTEREIVAERLVAERQALAEVAKELFADLDAKQARANELRFQRTPRTKAEEDELGGLDHQIIEITDGFFAITDILEIWVDGHLDRADELRVCLHFVERGILEEITKEEAEEMRKYRKDYFALSQEERKRESYPVEYFTAWDVDAEAARYFCRREYPREEYNAKGAAFRDESKRLMAALSAHYAQVRRQDYESREQEKKVEQERRAAAQERREQEEALAAVLDMQVNPSMSLDEVEDGSTSADPTHPLVRVTLEKKHGWKMWEGGDPLDGVIYLLSLGKESERSEWARFQLMGATKGIRHFLLKKELEAGRIFRYRFDTEFAGISREEEDGSWTHQPFLRRLFGVLMGIEQTHIETPPSFNPILAAMEEGKKGKEERSSSRSDHRSGGDGGPRSQQGGRRRKPRGGANDWRHQFGYDKM